MTTIFKALFSLFLLLPIQSFAGSQVICADSEKALNKKLSTFKKPIIEVSQPSVAVAPKSNTMDSRLAVVTQPKVNLEKIICVTAKI